MRERRPVDQRARADRPQAAGSAQDRTPPTLACVQGAAFLRGALLRGLRKGSPTRQVFPLRLRRGDCLGVRVSLSTDVLSLIPVQQRIPEFAPANAPVSARSGGRRPPARTRPPGRRGISRNPGKRSPVLIAIRSVPTIS
jgi:hypothetical protein